MGVCAGAHMCQRVSMCLIVPLHVSLWVVVHDSHGSMIPLIMTTAWRNRLPFSAAVTEKRSQVDKPHQQI